MRKSSKLRRESRVNFSAWLAPALIGLAVYIGFPTVAAYSDLATFLSGINRGGERWRMYMTPSPAGSIHEVEMVFADPITTGALDGGAGIDLPDGHPRHDGRDAPVSRAALAVAPRVAEPHSRVEGRRSLDAVRREGSVQVRDSR